MQYVIIGAGPAGVVAAEQLRKLHHEGEVTLIGDEPEEPYSRMAIPYLLIDNIDIEGTYLRKTQSHYQLKGIDVLRDRVESIDTQERKLALRSGGNKYYDRLLICTGSRPIVPPIPGMDLPRVVNCWTLEDARKIMRYADPGARVLLIGAGFIGCIVLEALARRGVKLNVVEMGDRMVPRMMSPLAGNMLRNWCESKGVHVHTSTRVEQVEPLGGGQAGGMMSKLLGAMGLGSKVGGNEDGPMRVTLSNGQVLEADLVISAAGVRPNIEFLQDSGVEIQSGIMIDHYMQTSTEHIYAAGDVAQGRDFSTGEFQVHAIQPTAVEHGRIAAQNMHGTPTYFTGSFNMNVLDTMGLISSSFGMWMGVEDGHHAELCDEERYRYLRLEFKDDVMVGANSLGLTQHVGVLRGLIQGKVPLGQWIDKLKHDPTRVMDAYLACNHLAKAGNAII